METILTVLSTIGVGALAYAFAGVIRLSRRVNDLELVRMEIDDIETRCNKDLENEGHYRKEDDNAIHRRIDEYQVQVESSTDRRFDKVWAECHILNDRVKQLDTIINPNKDLVN